MDESIQARLQDVEEITLALLVALVAEQHCMFSTEEPHVSSLAQRIHHACQRDLGLQPAIVDCNPETSIDDFNEALLIDGDEDPGSSFERMGSTTSFERPLKYPSFSLHSPGALHGSNALEHRRIADVVIAQSLDAAPDDVQIQALELIRSKRIFTRSSMQVAPKGLLVVTILSRPRARLTHHLQDMFCMSHHQSPDDTLAYRDVDGRHQELPRFTPKDLESLRTTATQVDLIAEVAQYVHDIEIFLRSDRFVKGGVTATATRHLRKLPCVLAALHGLDYVPPSLVALAARKIYPHRLILATAQNEESLLWGSDPEAIEELLVETTPESVIEEVLRSVEAPL